MEIMSKLPYRTLNPPDSIPPYEPPNATAGARMACFFRSSLMMAAQSALAYAVGLQASFGVIDDGKQGRQCTVFFLFLLFSLFFSSEKTTRHATYCSTTRGRRQHRSPDGVQWTPCAPSCSKIKTQEWSATCEVAAPAPWCRRQSTSVCCYRRAPDARAAHSGARQTRAARPSPLRSPTSSRCC